MKQAHRTQLGRLLTAAVALVVLVTACSRGTDDASSASVGGGPSSVDGGAVRDDMVVSGGSSIARDGQDTEAPADAAQEGSGAGEEGNLTDTDGPSPADFGRSIVYTATTIVEVDDVVTAAAQAKSAIARLGGIVFGEQTQTGEVDRTTLEFRVRPDDFQEALGRLGDLGRLESQEISADDVTERVVDLRSRIATSEVSVGRLRALLERASDLDSITRLENELLQRETSLEMLRGQLRTIEDQVDLATIWLSLHEPAAPQPEPRLEYEVAFADGDEGGENCGSGFEALEVDEGDRFSVCVTVTNTGNTILGNIEIRDDGLDLRGRDFSFVGGSGGIALAPDASVTAWAALDAPAFGHSAVRVAAVAFDDQGRSLRIGAETERIDRAHIEFVEDTSLPGIVDSLSGSWHALQVIGYVLVLALAAAVPFVWLVGVAWWGARRWRTARSAAGQLTSPEAPSEV